MEDRSNIIKEAIEYRDKLEKKVEELAQSVVRLQISLDFADNTIKKKDKENAELKAYKDINEDFKKAWEELKAENARLKSCLQEIKKIAEELSCKHPEECFENKPDWNGEVYGCDVADNWKNPSELATCPSKLASAILQIITKAESEG